MSARRLTEGTVTTIRDYLKANIATALADVRIDRADAAVSTEIPQNYFLYRQAVGYRCPAIFVIADNFDNRLKETQSNFVNGKVAIKVSVVVEDRDQDRLTIKAWRYDSALHELLQGAGLTSSDGKIALKVLVQRQDYSDHFTNGVKAGGAEAAFRKEIVLSCEVEHYESL